MAYEDIDAEATSADILQQLGDPVGSNNPYEERGTLQELSIRDDVDALMRDYYYEDPAVDFQTAAKPGIADTEQAMIDEIFGTGTKEAGPATQQKLKNEKSRKEAFALPASPVGQLERDIQRLSQEQKKQLGLASEAETEALKAEQTLNKRIAIIEDFRTRRIAAEKRDLQTAENTRQDSLRDARNDITTATDMVLNSEIDPNRIYKSTGQKIGAALAMALGAAGAALTGTENGAMRILESAIDRDIAAQRMEIENLKFVVGQKQNAYSMLKDQFGDDRKAEEMMRAMGHQYIDNFIQQMKVQYNLDANQSRLTAIEAKNKAAMAAVEERYAMALFNGRMSEWSTNMQLMGRAGTGSGSADYGLSADLKTKLSGALMSRSMLDNLIEGAEDKGALKGAGSKLVPFYTNADAFQTETDALAMRIINALSGATFTDAQFEAVKARLPFKTDSVKTKKRKLQLMRDEMEKNISAIGALVPLEFQNEFFQRYGTQSDEALLAKIEGR
tara:strand:+ start:13 stop:1521 length:1509 start_codon:yes stop_codon:yes gene_type:complete